MKSFFTGLGDCLASIVIAIGLVAWVYLIADVAASNAIRKHDQVRHAHPEPAAATEKP